VQPIRRLTASTAYESATSLTTQLGKVKMSGNRLKRRKWDYGRQFAIGKTKRVFLAANRWNKPEIRKKEASSSGANVS